MSVTKWRHILSMGQSLGNGTTAGSNATSNQPYNGMTLYDRSGRFDITKTTQTTLTMKAAIGPQRTTDPVGASNYPSNIVACDLAIHVINQLGALISGAAWVDTCVCIGGQSITAIKKGGTMNAYAAAQWEVGRVQAEATLIGGLTYDIPCILLTHGEADSTSATYAVDVMAGICTPAQTDYAGLFSGILPTFATQQSTSPNNAAAPTSSLQMLVAEANNAGYFYVLGPKYQYTYPPTNQHLNGDTQYRLLGEMIGWGIYQRLVNGKDIGLKPTGYALSNSNKTITISMNVFAGPIVIDSSVGNNHSSVNTQWGPTGFEAKDDSGNLTIDSVSVSGNSVIVNLHATPTTGLKVGYALTPDTNDGGYHGGQGGGARWGQVRDSDTFVGAVSGTGQHNWLCHFQSGALT